jgi:hypothetical protein
MTPELLYELFAQASSTLDPASQVLVVAGHAYSAEELLQASATAGDLMAER